MRWRALDRDARLTLVGVAALTLGGLGVRAWLIAAYPPAFLGFGDSWQYAAAAARGIFSNPQHPAGYPLFLDAVHLISSDVTSPIITQHMLSIGTGLLLFASVWMTGAPPWLGLLPAAVVFFGATGLILEHSLLADPLLAFLQALSIYCTVRALYERSLLWPLLAGVAVGLSFWVKTVAISGVFVIPLLLALGAPGPTRRRLRSGLAALTAVGVLVIAYVAIQDLATGYLGYERQGAWNLYGRVATFVDCSKFTPPRGTRFLCPSEPLGHRASENVFQYASSSPAVKRFGRPLTAGSHANEVLQEFSVAAIEHEPLAYAKAIVRGLGFYFSPRSGEGYTPQAVRTEVMNAENEVNDESGFALLYSNPIGYLGTSTAAQPLATYEKYTLLEGVPLIILLACAALAPFVLPRGMRWPAAAFTLTAIFSIVFAIAGNSYDARYAYPTFGPIVAAAALGGWALARVAMRMAGDRTRRAKAGAGDGQAKAPAG